MTHVNNYEHQKRWRARKKEIYMQIQRIDKLKRYYYKQAVKELLRIDTHIFQ
jgi:hypothetical protein